MSDPLSTHKAIDQFPSLPQVLVKILDAIQAENADFQQLADIIRQDPAVTTKLLQVASSSYFGRSQNCSTIERALMFLGTDTVKTIVITCAIKQFFNHFSQEHSQFLKQFWRRSLITANFAQALATLTSYANPDEAYLCGLLTDMGQLILLTEFGQDYVALTQQCSNNQALTQQEQSNFKYDHCEVAADIVDSWRLSDFMGDAIRYHHESPDQIQDAQHLVKIIYLSNLMASSEQIDEQALSVSHRLFGLNDTLSQEIHSRILVDVDNMAASLNIDVSQDDTAHHQELGKRLGQINEINQVNQTLAKARCKQSLIANIEQSLLLTFGIQQSLLFDYDQAQNSLNHNADEGSPLSIVAQAGRSLAADALLSKTIQHSATSEQTKLPVIDRQLIRLCQAEQIICLPLITEHETYGVLVLGASSQQFKELEPRLGQLSTIGKEIAQALNNLGTQGPAVTDTQQQLQSSIREAVHEASNPLSIIRNYLEMLTIKLGEEHDANENLNLIKEEIDRVGQILLRLKDPEEQAADGSDTDINAIISGVVQIFKNSTCASKQINLELQLDSDVKPQACNGAYLKQIVTNLIKNACEALTAGDSISVSSEANVNSNGRHYTAIIVSDNGPGMPKQVKEHLFTPQESTKGGNHSGLGLSIVKKLIEEMGGTITCRSTEKTNNQARSGTEFHILLPQ